MRLQPSTGLGSNDKAGGCLTIKSKLGWVDPVDDVRAHALIHKHGRLGLEVLDLCMSSETRANQDQVVCGGGKIANRTDSLA